MDIFAQIRWLDYSSNNFFVFKLVRLELGGVDTNMHVWSLISGKNNAQYYLKKSISQQFYINGKMHFPFSEDDIK